MGCKYVKEFEFPSSGKVSVRGYQRGGPVKKADGGAVKIDVDMSKPAKAVPVPKGKPVVGPSRAQFDKALAVRKDADDKTANFGKTPAERRQLIGGEGVYKARGGKVCAPKFK